MGKGRPMADAERFIKWHQVGRRSEKINFAPCFSSEPAIQAPGRMRDYDVQKHKGDLIYAAATPVEGTEGNSNNAVSFTFSSRYQQVFNASEFASVADLCGD